MIYWEETGSKKYLKLLIFFIKKKHSPLVKLNRCIEFGAGSWRSGQEDRYVSLSKSQSSKNPGHPPASILHIHP